MELPYEELRHLLAAGDAFQAKINEAVQVLQLVGEDDRDQQTGETKTGHTRAGAAADASVAAVPLPMPLLRPPLLLA